MFKKTLLFMLLMTLLAPWAVGQQALPYSYGFEDNALATDGWTSTGGAISSAAAYNSSSYGYRFSYSISSDVFLMSPILTGGTKGVNVSFYYKAYSGSYLDHFYVGYTTDETVTDPSAFTYGAMVTSSTSWQLYEDALPAGTVRVAIKYDADNYDDGYYLYLDDFSFTVASSCAAPTNALVSYTSGSSTATVTWEGSAPSYKIDVNGTVTNNVSSPYTLNVTPATSYTIKVQADCGSEQSVWVNAGSFTTDCPASFNIPYSYGFEDAAGMDCWQQIDCELASGYYGSAGSYAHTGNGCYYFSSYNGTTDPQYLVSPMLSGIANGLHVEFWYRKGPNGTESFKVGYTTNDIDFNNFDPADFVWDSEVTSLTATYQQYKANYMGAVKYVCVQYTGSDSYYVFLDDFVFEEAPNCLEPTGVTVTNETTTGATVSWTAGGSESEWDIFLTTDPTVVPDDATTPTVANTTDNPYTLTGLTPATTYYLYVRAICSKPSGWTSPVEFHTECDAMSLPYSYNFNTGDLTVCWNIIQTNPTYTGWELAQLATGDYAFMFFRGTSSDDLAVVLPEVDASYPLNGYQISFNAAYYNGSSYNMTAGKLGVGIMTDPDDFSTFELIEEIDVTNVYSSSTFGTTVYNVMFNNYTGKGQYIAISDIYTQNGYVLIDNIEVTELPACIPPTNVAISGGANAVLTWDGSATSYQVAYSTDGTANPDDNIISTDVTATTFDLSTYVQVGDNYVWVRSNCGSDHSVWVDAYLDLNYCTPVPSSHDGSGITAVSFGTGAYVVNNGDGSASLPASSPFYGDYTSMIGAVNAGVESTIAITTGTGSYPYTFVIWVDLDNSYTFDDSEILYIGKASSGNGTLNATITVPATQALGDYRMRIYGADSYFTSFYGNGTTNWSAAHDPCSSGSYRHAHDYTLRVLEAPSCLAPTGLDADNITTNSADLSWTANSGETSWNIFYKKTSETEYTELKKVTDNPYQLTGLDAATDYEYYVVANCSSTETSDPSAVYYFTTECGAITITAAKKYTQNFESPVVNSVYNSTTGLEVPVCWENPYTTSSSAAGNPHLVRAGASYNYSSSQVLLFYGSGYNYVTLPEFTNALNELQITFKWATESSSSGTLTLGYITDGDVNYNTFTEISGASYPASSSSYHTMIQAAPVYLDALPATAKRLVFRWYYSSQYSCNVDDVEVSLMPSCYPLGTLTYDNLASQTVDLHWTLVDATQDAWQVCLNNDETNLIDITATDVTISGNAVTYSLSGLTAETAYTVKVRANCGGSDFSDWSNIVSFTTLAACATPTGLAANNLTMNTADLTWTGSSDVAAYTVQYRTAAGLQTHYFEGFEDGLGDWTKVDCASSTGISTGSSYAHTGNAAFKFSYNTNPPQYLVSPAISGITSGMQLEFWYKNGSTSYTETFQVGFSSTDNDVASFAFEDEITASDAQWHSYSVAVPATTKYLCFKLNSNDQLSLYIDDITIGAVVAAGTWQTAANDVTAWNYELAGLTASVKYDARVYANCETNPDANNAMTTFTTLADGNIVFPDDGNWIAGNFEPTGAPTVTDNVIIRADVTVTSGTNAYANNIALENSSVITVANGATLTLAGNVTGGTSASIIVEQGGQLIHSNAVNATLQINVTGYSSKADNAGYRLIASPINSSYYSPSSSGLTTGTYDLYSFDQSQDLEWRNYEAGAFSYLTLGKGYLYANASGVNGTFAGSTVKTDTDKTYTLAYTTGAELAGWNLVGNPFTCNAYVKVNNGTETNYAPYYVLNTTGDALNATAVAAGTPVVPMQGLFVQATATGQSCIFTTTTPSKDSNLNLKVSQNSAMVDNAIISFRDGSTLEKLSFNEGSTKVYMPVDGKDYAVVNAESKGEMPVNFKAETNGTYTLSFSTENVEFGYLHLIDNMNGNDVDLLATPSYTFDAQFTDYASRFKLVFATTNATDDQFAFISDGEIILSGVNGNTTVQLFDVTGRMLSSTNGVNRLSTENLASGVYMLRVINGNETRTQKIIVK